MWGRKRQKSRQEVPGEALQEEREATGSAHVETEFVLNFRYPLLYAVSLLASGKKGSVDDAIQQNCRPA